MTRKRVTVSLDADLVDYVQAEVREGRADSVSAWVSSAMRRHLEHERRLEAGRAWIAAYEAEHGVITEEEMDEAERWMRESAIPVRPSAKSTRGSRAGAA